jgi:hypothetical protein
MNLSRTRTGVSPTNDNMMIVGIITMFPLSLSGPISQIVAD